MTASFSIESRANDPFFFDANLAAIRDLRSNAEAAGLAIASHNLHTEEFLKKLDEKPDLVVLDPPRSGLGQSTAAKLAEVQAPGPLRQKLLE